jgi:hypothetical protein
MNKLRIAALTLVPALCALCLTGCGGGYAPVSGVVMVNGKPAKGAIVEFQPMSTVDNTSPGRASTGATDENGKFTLKTGDGKTGAVVGKHRVRILHNYSDKNAEPIPAEWNSASKQEFDVPSGGTDEANFNIDTKKK